MGKPCRRELFTGRLGAGTSSLSVLPRRLPAAEVPNAQFSPLKTHYLVFTRPETLILAEQLTHGKYPTIIFRKKIRDGRIWGKLRKSLLRLLAGDPTDEGHVNSV